MNCTRAACGHSVPAVGMVGSPARLAMEREVCDLDLAKGKLAGIASGLSAMAAPMMSTSRRFPNTTRIRPLTHLFGVTLVLTLGGRCFQSRANDGLGIRRKMPAMRLQAARL
jgi:hypothetical protein